MANPENVFIARFGNIGVDNDLGAGIRFPRGFCLTNNHQMLFERMGAVLQESFGRWLGLHEQAMLRQSRLFAYLFDLDTSDLKDRVHRILLDLDGLQTFLWLFKDNAAQMARGVVVFESEPCFVVQQSSISTKCDASSHPTSFSKSEIECARDLYDVVFPILGANDAANENVTELIHRGKSRMARAFRFIETARRTTSLAIKIASHCSAIESLLRFDNGRREERLAENLRKRVAAVLDHPSMSKPEIENVVREMYIVRSKLFHGQHMDDRRAMCRLRSIASNADNVVRNLVDRIFHNEDLGPRFVESLSQKDDNNLQRKLDRM